MSAIFSYSARLASPRACSCTVANRGHGDACYPAPREPWRCERFRCPGCNKWRPFCEGAADKYGDVCDACAAPLIAAEKGRAA